MHMMFVLLVIALGGRFGTSKQLWFWSMLPRPLRASNANRAWQGLVIEIKHFTRYAAIAYCNHNERRASNRNSKMLDRNSVLRGEISDKETGTHALLYVNFASEEIIVAFRGSDSIAKFLYAYLSSTAAFPGVKGAWVHADTLRFANSIRHETASYIAKYRLRFPKYRVVLVGHSLGGSLATIMSTMVAADLCMEPHAMRVITYGQLRVGNRVFAEHYNRLGFNYSRVVNKQDPAANHPSFDDGWAHVHQEVYIDQADNFFLCSNRTLEDPQCSHKMSRALAIFTDHEYVAGIKISPRGCGWLDII
ncbi:hypothetical protein DSO57_1012499 [Entomophthora muscae]|uniref:Uncharacterized protein n=1 Tax=Entomophthora muscae TaxID=34485 RepID=A0ACC2T626_9FUNG|nr:hypothetical protein DSO57_1012499 [Entomophthora muscae]